MAFTTVFSRRLLSCAATTAFVKTAYPLCVPTDDELTLGAGNPFVHEARAIARKVGVKNAHNIQLVVATQGEEGGAIGVNFSWFNWGTISVSREVYESYFEDNGYMTQDEVKFILAHESVHLARNHPLQMAAFLPISMITSVLIASRFRHPLVSTMLGIAIMTTSGIFLSWQMEYEADHDAAMLGSEFLRGGVETFERTRRQNCKIKGLNPTHFITSNGNYLMDTSHPWLTSRIDHLQKLNNEVCTFCSLKAALQHKFVK